jgi:hypothetical protein
MTDETLKILQKEYKKRTRGINAKKRREQSIKAVAEVNMGRIA